MASVLAAPGATVNTGLKGKPTMKPLPMMESEFLVLCATTYRTAADKLESKGWCQDEEQDDSGRMCADEAIFVALKEDLGLSVYSESGTVIQQRVTQKFSKFISDGLGTPSLRIQEWNDKSGRTVDEVLVTLRKAADECEQETSNVLD